MFQVPESSSPPSTPESRKTKSPTRFQASHPSTTPAGPPPSSFTNHSTTPSGPPPSSLFGNKPLNYSFQQSTSTPSRPRNNATRQSPLKFASSCRSEQSFDAMEEDQDADDFSISVHDRDQIIPGLDPAELSKLARSIASRPAPLHETDDIILGTDQIIEQLYTLEQQGGHQTAHWDNALAQTCQQLLHILKRRQDPNIVRPGIGPGSAATNTTKAIFLSSLLLSLHHPITSSYQHSTSHTSRRTTHPAPIPEILVGWLREYHDPFPNEYTEVLNHQDGPAASDRFWDVCFAQSVRGNVKELCVLLKEADFAVAHSALEDGADRVGYEGQQLANVQRVINRARGVFEDCPARVNGDWDVKGANWAAYRKRVHQARRDLETFAEGSLGGRGQESINENVNEFSMRQMSRRAQSKVPWSIYENLRQLYGQVLGWAEEIGAACADWLEATVALTIWWPGDEDSSASTFRHSNRMSMTKSKRGKSVDHQPLIGYQDRLAVSFEHVTGNSDEAELQVNTTDPVQVGLACIFEGDIEGLLQILKGWSAPISNAVVEIANFGHWLNKTPSPSKSLMNDFSKSDLMVLSVAKHDKEGIDFDQELINYANLLNERPILRDHRSGDSFRGWQLAVQVLSRVRNEATSDTHITSIMESLELDKEVIDKATTLCRELDMLHLARRLSEKFADQLAQSTSNYGDALLYYARARDFRKVKDLLNLLVTTSLVYSCAYPPASSLDPLLQSLVSSPGAVLSDLQNIDGVAANMLANHLSGYATLRRYYDLRDGEDEASKPKQALRPLARRRAAADALVSVVMSAADSIHGGLFDDSVDSVVPIECLYVLLGETLTFINQDTTILSTSQIFALLKAIDDVSTVSSAFAAKCDDCFKSALAAAKGAQPPSPQLLLKRSATESSGTGSSSSFSLVNMVSSDEQSNSSMDGSGVLVKGKGNRRGQSDIQRGWDWRTGFSKTTKAEDMLLILRLGLAREVSKAWTRAN